MPFIRHTTKGEYLRRMSKVLLTNIFMLATRSVVSMLLTLSVQIIFSDTRGGDVRL